MVFAPEYVRQGYFFLNEEDAEAVVIFFFSLLGFLFYLAKERALGKVQQEQRLVKQEKKIISLDLENSYSYIGEVNRKFEILKHSIGALPGAFSIFKRSDQEEDLYRPLLDAVKTLSKVNAVAFYFMHVSDRRVEWTCMDGKEKIFSGVHPESLLHEKTRRFWLEDDFYRASSPKLVNHLRCFIVFPKNVNDIDDHEIFKILASEALFLFCLVRRGKNT